MWVYLAAVAAGLLVGTARPGVGEVTNLLVWPALALLLYATFVQLPTASLRRAFRDRRFVAGALVGHFLVLPVFAWALVQFAPPDPAVRLGLLLVLLVPCTDWFISFTHLGGGDAARAVALTPLTLMLQLALLPLYLWLMTDGDVASVMALSDLWPAVLVVLGPLVAAMATRRWAGGVATRQRHLERAGWWPVPLLGLVILLIAAGNANVWQERTDLLLPVMAICGAFLVASAVLAIVVSAVTGLPAAAGRTLAFAFGTRNSFVVLPFALALPAGWEAAAMVIVLQSLVELLAMIGYVWFVPTVMFPGREPREVR